MRNKKTEKFPIKFIFFILAVTVLLIWYISYDNENDKSKYTKHKTFEEMLEYSKIEIKPFLMSQNKEEQEQEQEENDINSKDDKSNEINTIIENPYKEKPILNSTEKYNNLLDEFKTYPNKNESSIHRIISKILEYKGYKNNTLNILIKDIDQTKSKTESSYQAAQFDFITGNLSISPKIVYSMDIKEITAILVHEIDHFDKLAKTCKYMGINDFTELFNENNININTIFWDKVSENANIKDFDGEEYKTALKRFITQNQIELLSSYANFYRLAENLRNPLEISAYKASDYVYNYYGIPITEGPVKKLVNLFNKVDWAIYNKISSDKNLKNERISIFDYCFAKAILNKMPELEDIFNNCKNQKNGDLTDFWVAFETALKGFYYTGKMDQKTYDSIYTIMSKTYEESEKELNSQEISSAIKYKINTLLSNIVYPNAIQNIRAYILDYLRYTQENNITVPQDELKYILTLICIDNELYESNKQPEFSLYYIKVPEELSKLYDIPNKKKRFVFIYDNKAFKEFQQKAGLADDKALVELLNQNRLNIKIKN